MPANVVSRLANHWYRSAKNTDCVALSLAGLEPLGPIMTHGLRYFSKSSVEGSREVARYVK